MTQLDLSVNIAGVRLKNPVMSASGTFGSGKELSRFFDINTMGAIVTKTVTLTPRLGNPPVRIAETPSGLLNSIGLQNPGIDRFIEDDLAFLKPYDTVKIISILGESLEEFTKIIEKLNAAYDKGLLHMVELNLSCPNIDKGGLSFGVDPDGTRWLISNLKKIAKMPLIAKLSPNVTDIKIMGKAAQEGGADAVSLINTLLGMSIDIHKKKFDITHRKVAGLSGSAVKPVAVRMVWEVASVVSIPIIGMGGISDSDDAIEFMMVGATGVAVGTASFTNPLAIPQTINGIRDYMLQYGIADIKDIPKLK